MSVVSVAASIRRAPFQVKGEAARGPGVSIPGLGEEGTDLEGAWIQSVSAWAERSGLIPS